MKKKISFHTFGCRLNQAETASIRQHFFSQGHEIVEEYQQSEIAVINTCTVTQNGDANTRKMVNRMVRSNPTLQIALIGCQAQMQAKNLASLPNVHWVVGNAKKMDLASIIEDSPPSAQPIILDESIPKTNFTIPHDGLYLSQTRPNVKIQDGCDFFCFFCEIPYARGRARSRAFFDIIREVKNLVTAGYQEIVLTGINLGTYQDDGKSFIDVIEALEKIVGLKRIRISSIEPTTISESILDNMSLHPSLCRHLHIPLQSGSNALLHAMNRRYTKEEYRSFIERAVKKIPGLCVGTDVIVGYPGETSSLFDETYDFLQQVDIAYFHVFSYSERTEARSKRFSGVVSSKEIRRRSQVLRELGERKRRAFMETFIGKTMEVLLEKQKGMYWTGLTDNFLRVFVSSEKQEENQLVPVLLEKVDSRGIIGIINEQ